jgi:hypothetical protein
MYRWFWKSGIVFFFACKTFLRVFREGLDLFWPPKIALRYAQDNFRVKKVPASSKNPAKCPIICFARKKIISQTFKISGTLIVKRHWYPRSSDCGRTERWEWKPSWKPSLQVGITGLQLIHSAPEILYIRKCLSFNYILIFTVNTHIFC